VKASQKGNRTLKKMYGTVLSEQPPQPRQPPPASGHRRSSLAAKAINCQFLAISAFSRTLSLTDNPNRFTSHISRNAAFTPNH
jgi:hypothetical protein